MSEECDPIEEVEFADEFAIAYAAEAENPGGCLGCGGTTLVLSLGAFAFVALMFLYW